MIVCQACELMFANNSNFIRHSNLSHSHLKGFPCAETKCQKSFFLFDSFIKHIRRKHAAANENAVPSLQNSSLSVEDS